MHLYDFSAKTLVKSSKEYVKTWVILDVTALILSIIFISTGGKYGIPLLVMLIRFRAYFSIEYPIDIVLRKCARKMNRARRSQVTRLMYTFIGLFLVSHIFTCYLCNVGYR